MPVNYREVKEQTKLIKRHADSGQCSRAVRRICGKSSSDVLCRPRYDRRSLYDNSLRLPRSRYDGYRVEGRIQEGRRLGCARRRDHGHLRIPARKLTVIIFRNNKIVHPIQKERIVRTTFERFLFYSDFYSAIIFSSQPAMLPRSRI